jgi:hypothetical protein
MPPKIGHVDTPLYAGSSLARTASERLLCVLAWLVLAVSDAALTVLGFTRTWRLVSAWRGPSSAETEINERVRNIQRAVDRSCVYYFRQAECLRRSITTIVLLRLCGVRAELVVGIQRVPFQAHCWVELCGELVNEHPARRHEFVVIHRD